MIILPKVKTTYHRGDTVEVTHPQHKFIGEVYERLDNRISMFPVYRVIDINTKAVHSFSVNYLKPFSFKIKFHKDD